MPSLPLDESRQFNLCFFNAKARRCKGRKDKKYRVILSLRSLHLRAFALKSFSQLNLQTVTL